MTENSFSYIKYIRKNSLLWHNSYFVKRSRRQYSSTKPTSIFLIYDLFIFKIAYFSNSYCVFMFLNSIINNNLLKALI